MGSRSCSEQQANRDSELGLAILNSCVPRPPQCWPVGWTSGQAHREHAPGSPRPGAPTAPPNHAESPRTQQKHHGWWRSTPRDLPARHGYFLVRGSDHLSQYLGHTWTHVQVLGTESMLLLGKLSHKKLVNKGETDRRQHEAARGTRWVATPPSCPGRPEDMRKAGRTAVRAARAAQGLKAEAPLTLPQAGRPPGQCGHQRLFWWRFCTRGLLSAPQPGKTQNTEVLSETTEQVSRKPTVCTKIFLRISIFIFKRTDVLLVGM